MRLCMTQNALNDFFVRAQFIQIGSDSTTEPVQAVPVDVETLVNRTNGRANQFGEIGIDLPFGPSTGQGDRLLRDDDSGKRLRHGEGGQAGVPRIDGKSLREFLERVNAVNERRDLAHRVESVIVFFSYLSEVSRLNDLDLSVELVGNGTDDSSQQALHEASFNRARASGRQFRNAVDQIFWPRMEVLSLLKNRSRTISFCEWDSLKDMPKLRYAVLLGDKSRIASFIKDGEAVDLPADKDAV